MKPPTIVMSEDNSLAIMSRAAVMLADANTIQKAKELKDMAITAGEWARRKNMGEAAIQHCRSYALEAERKMGEMLAQTERAKGAAAGGKKESPRGNYIEPRDSNPTLDDIGISKRESSEAQKLATIPEERFEALKAGVTTKKEALNPTHVGHNSGDNEWYTPPEFIDAARKAMGSITCDPASSDIANKTVKADVYFTAEQDGLKQKWNGNVWMNPPYSTSLIGQFSKAISEKFVSGEVSEACILVNNATETAWFQEMIPVCSAICLVKTRVKFLDPEGNPGAPLQGQIVIYLGKNQSGFAEHFQPFGPVLQHVVGNTKPGQLDSESVTLGNTFQAIRQGWQSGQPSIRHFGNMRDGASAHEC